MTSLSVVTGWRPEPLAEAGDRLAAAARTLEQQAVVVRRSLGVAVEVGGGAWAATAESRAWQESRTGLALADGLRAAADLLRAGAGDLARARDVLVERVALARAAGFQVADDGSVTSPDALPPLDLVGATLAPERREQAHERMAEAAGHSDDIARALADLLASDEALARSLAEVELPQTLESVVVASLRRSGPLGDPVAALGAAGGAVALGRAAKDGYTAVRKGRALGRYARLAGRGLPADDALRAFTHGTSRSLVGRVAGRAFLPATVATGTSDAWTGAGHDGARGWATRGFGAAGAVGAGALIGSSVGLVALGPAGITVAGGAVLAYGAWTAGNYLVDHWEQVEDLHDAAASWATAEAHAMAGDVGEAVDWVHDQLSAADDVIGDVGAEALDLVGSLW